MFRTWPWKSVGSQRDRHRAFWCLPREIPMGCDCVVSAFDWNAWAGDNTQIITNSNDWKLLATDPCVIKCDSFNCCHWRDTTGKEGDGCWPVLLSRGPLSSTVTLVYTRWIAMLRGTLGHSDCRRRRPKGIPQLSQVAAFRITSGKW